MPNPYHNTDWKNDDRLKNSLQSYVRQNMQRSEILSFMHRDFQRYTWSLRSLDRRLRYYGIYYVDKKVTIEELKAIVRKELNGPGRLLGYRTMHLKLRQIHKINIPRNLVYDIMFDVDPQGLEDRAPLQIKKRKRGFFTSKGPDWVHSMDGHDKLMGYQNSTFPLAIYGSIDTASRKILWLKVWTSNSDPRLIGRWYFDYLFETKRIPSIVRVDKGTETGVMATIHAYLRQNNEDMDPVNTVIFGPSTSNQIERWWRELHERLEKFFKPQLHYLKEHGHYDPFNKEDRYLLAFVMVPVIDKQLEIFRSVVWNSHRIRFQKTTLLPTGIPNHIYDFPEEYALENCGWPVTEQQLREVAELSGVLQVPSDFLEEDFREKCERIIPYPHEIEPLDCQESFIYLKEKFQRVEI